MMMCPVPAKDEEDGRKNIEGNEQAQEPKEQGWDYPGCGVAMKRIKGLRSPKKIFEKPGHGVCLPYRGAGDRVLNRRDDCGCSRW